MNLQVLIIDDEPLAQEVLQTYLQKIPGLEVAATCGNALEAFGVLNSRQVDLMLLDINMPEITGMAFLRSLKNPPPVIFTTAYSEFAADSYELDAIDYLVKPVAFDRFLKAIRKAQEAIRPAVPVPPAATDAGIMFVRAEGRLVKIDLAQLWMVEGLKDYVILWTGSGRVVVHHTMKHLEEQLTVRPQFLRVHKSYIINLRYVTEVDGNAIRIRDQSIAIGNTYRDAVHAVFNSYKLL